MWGGPVFSARIKYAGRGGPARVVRAGPKRAGPTRIATPNQYYSPPLQA